MGSTRQTTSSTPEGAEWATQVSFPGHVPHGAVVLRRVVRPAAARHYGEAEAYVSRAGFAEGGAQSQVGPAPGRRAMAGRVRGQCGGIAGAGTTARRQRSRLASP